VKDRIPELRKCSCGLVIATEATFEKYQILDEICEVNDYSMIIDACAGSGMIALGDRLIPGSPIILASLAKKKKSKCVFIESENSTFGLLQANLGKYELLDSSYQNIVGDCNDHLLDLVKDPQPTLVYIDPFGYCYPPIKREVVLEISKKGHVDLLINFFWRICRQIGFAKRNLKSLNSRNRSTAQSYKKSLDVYWGVGQLSPQYSDWFQWKKMHPFQYAEKYAKPLGDGKAQVIGLPRYHRVNKENKFFLIFTTHQNRLKLGLQKYMS
jgi:three-Cys-motif partner protein